MYPSKESNKLWVYYFIIMYTILLIKVSIAKASSRIKIK